MEHENFTRRRSVCFMVHPAPKRVPARAPLVRRAALLLVIFAVPGEPDQEEERAHAGDRAHPPPRQ